MKTNSKMNSKMNSKINSKMILGKVPSYDTYCPAKWPSPSFSCQQNTPSGLPLALLYVELLVPLFYACFSGTSTDRKSTPGSHLKAAIERLHHVAHCVLEQIPLSCQIGSSPRGFFQLLELFQSGQAQKYQLLLPYSNQEGCLDIDQN